MYMKKQFFFLAIATALLAGCKSQKSDMDIALQGEPIMPVHYTGDTTTVYLTDYLPGVDLATIAKIELPSYEMLNNVGDSMQIVGHSQYVEVMTVTDGKTAVEIPVLPHNNYCQGLTSLGCDNKMIRLGFVGKLASEDLTPRFVCFVQNKQLPSDCVQKQEDGTFSLSLNELKAPAGRSYLRVYAADETHLFNDLLIPLQDGKPVMDAALLNRHDANAQVLYSLLVDRFYNGNPDNDAPLNIPEVDPRVDYKGGDLKGITEKINAGFFDELGISTIWISPITQNPQDAWGQYHNPDTKFSGYHGYWPIFNTKVDDRMGTDEELREMLAAAHAHNINVVLDYVANHMHLMSPTLQEHPDWITDSILPDGRRNFELWDEARLTTWFDVHIPSLDLEREEVCDAMTDTALFWVSNFDFDGYRHDACKHIPLNYWRMFTHKMKTRFPERPLWMIGETYGDADLISSYVKTGMLNAQFDFNIYHTAIDVLGREGHSMEEIARVVEESLCTYGDHHTMGNISGNHDKTRFISLAGGAVSWEENSKDAGWHRQIGVTADGDQEKELRAFKKALLLEVLNFSIPGVPCVYQGDEFGQCGANDPDNRRMMRFDGLNENEQAFRKQMVELGKLRRNRMPLIFGDYNLILADTDVMVFTRTYMGETITVALNKGLEARDLVAGEQTIHVEPLSYTIL